jgi:LytR cell envelope-related transcriptional attenuator
VANGTDSDQQTQQTQSTNPPLGGRLIGAGFAVIGVILLVVGLLTVRGHSPGKPGAAPPGGTSAPASSAASSAPASSAPPTTSLGTSAPSGPGSSAPGSSAPGSSAAGSSAPGSAPAPSTPAGSAPGRTTGPPAPPAPARAPLTVLNNSTIHGLGDQVAASARTRGWQIATTGNFAGRIPVTTIYFDPGDSAGQRAAQEFAKEFPQVQRVFPRYAGLPPTPAGIVLVVTKDWVS